MVLCLPLLLFIMALMVNYGTVAGWRIRADSVAHYEAWGSRSRRSTGPRPEYWPESAGMGSGGVGSVDALEAWGEHQVMRGPALVTPRRDGGMASTGVHENLFDPTRGLRSGNADLRRGFPLLPTLGDYHLRARDVLLNNQWQFQETDVGSNSHRRASIIYDLTDPSLVAPFTALVVARNANLELLTRDQRLHPLDRDHEWNAYHARFPLVIGETPDFYPRFPRPPSEAPCTSSDGTCTLRNEAMRAQVDRLVDRIEGRPGEEGRRRVPNLAERMARAFRHMYQRVIDELEAQLQAGLAPPGAQAEINQLEQKIDTLDQFIAAQRG